MATARTARAVPAAQSTAEARPLRLLPRDSNVVGSGGNRGNRGSSACTGQQPAAGEAPSADDEQRRRFETLASNVARCALEAIGGTRDLDQLARWVTPAVYQALLARVQHAGRARRARRRAPTRANVRVLAVTTQHVDDAAEATVVVELGPRVRAVCIRLELDEKRWRASSVSVL